MYYIDMNCIDTHLEWHDVLRELRQDSESSEESEEEDVFIPDYFVDISRVALEWVLRENDWNIQDFLCREGRCSV